MTAPANLTESHTTPIPMRGTGAALLWALFLGCSWTWVIGMYFPVLLLRDYGLLGWVAFAIPNVVGAAAMGFTLKNPEVSRRIVAKHRSACLAFSQITVAYQVFMVTAYTGLVSWPIVMAVAFAFLFAGRSGTTRDGLIAAMVWAVSLALFAYLQTTGWLWLDADRNIGEALLDKFDLLMFLPASLFGFALCPYLDLTFHRARQETSPGTGRAAFAIGFGVVFFSMIVFSLAYAGALMFPFVERPTEVVSGVWQVVRWHMLIQAGFTIAVHWRSMEIVASEPGPDGNPGSGYSHLRKLVLALTAGLLAYTALNLGNHHLYEANDTRFFSISELVYRSFLILYGSAFPAYVLLCVIPTYRQVSHNAKTRVFVPTALLSYLLSYQAFVADQSLWVLAVIVVLVVARIWVECLPAKEGTKSTANP